MSIESLLANPSTQSLIDRTRQFLSDLETAVDTGGGLDGLDNQELVDQTNFLGVLNVFLRQDTQDAPSQPATIDSDNRTASKTVPPATINAPAVELPASLSASVDATTGQLHLSRNPGETLPWEQLPVNQAVASYWNTALIPDAQGLINGEVAPGLEGWNQLVNLGETQGLHGYRDYLDIHYPGGFDTWRTDYELYRRNALAGEDNAFSITNTSGAGRVEEVV